jgi:enoyl-CoA hydratase
MSSPTFHNLRYEVRSRAAWITIDRPDKLNALNRETVLELNRAVELAARDVEARVLVLGGSGERAFVAGADIQEMSELDAAAAQRFSHFLQESLDRLERGTKPVIAAVNGFALGGGCELAMACHLRIASETARFGQPEINLGLIPGAGGTQRLQRLVGRGRALEWILFGGMIDAATALRVGLVQRVVAPERLSASVEEWVEALSSKSPLALARALEAVIRGGECAMSEGLCQEAASFGLCFATADMQEGTRAFLEKRQPTFRGA